MRTTLSLLILCASLVACDVPKSVGDDDSTTTSGADSSAPDTAGAETTTPASAGSTSSGGAATSSASTPTAGGAETTAAAETGAEACPEFDPGPVDDPESGYSWECTCQTCNLSFPDIPLETVGLFDETGLCDCLCAEAGCGFAEGEGGVGGGPVETSSGAGSTGSPETDSFGETTQGADELTVSACLDQGGEVVGDPGDGTVFAPDYVCPSGESPLGVLEFEPGMPFPKNGGVCCF